VVSAKARGIPRQVLGRWTRTVTAAQVARTQGFRDPADGIPLPAGTWQVRIGADGVARYTGPTHDLTVGQVRFEPGGRLVVGNQIPNFPHASKGGFCAGTAGEGSTTGHSTAVRSPSGSSATISAPAATASGTAPSPGEPTNPRQRPQTPSKTGDRTARTHQAGPATKEET